MMRKRFVLQILTVPGLALVALILTMMMPAFVWADNPDITIVKEADQVIVSGTNATFAITVTNSGDITLTNVAVTDAKTSDCNWSPTGGTLNLGQIETYTCMSYDVAESFTNTAIVSGESVSDATVVNDDDTAIVTVADIDLQKTIATPIVLSGTNVTFAITVTNNGDVTLTSVAVTDPETPACSQSPSGGTLNPGQSETYTCSHLNVTASFTNVATVTAVAAPGLGLEATASAPVDVINPGIDVEVTPPTQAVSMGSNADFTITVENIGDAELDNVNVSATECGPLSGPFGDIGSDNKLNNGEIWTYICTRFSVPDGLINSVTVNAKSPINTDVTDSDAAEVILTEAATQCPADMTAYWKLDEGGQPYDDFYSGHDAQCVGGNCPAALTKGRVNGAQTFNGTSTRVNAPVIPGDDSFNWDKDASFSIEFWMRGVPGQTCAGTSSPGDNEVIIGRDDIGLHWWLGCLNTTGYANFQLSDGGVSLVSLSSPSSVTDGAWHHLVGVRDGVNKLNRFYVDGTEVHSVTHTYNNGFSSASAPLDIAHLGGAFHFMGDVDELAVYNKALSLPEIQTHYNGGIPGPGYCGGYFAPTIISTAPEYANVGEAYTYTVVAVGNSVPTYTLSITKPTGMIINSTTGVISWTPTVSQEGVSDVAVMASNSKGTDTQDFIITVLPAGVEPTQPVYLPLILK